jgi:hypothetical protein
MSTVEYTGDDGLTEVDVSESELDIQISYCLQCPCGLFRKDCTDRDGYVSLTHCPRSVRHEFVYYNPVTQERYAKDVIRSGMRQETACEIKAVCTYENIFLSLKDLLAIPKGWTLEVEEDSDYRDHLDLDLEMQLHRIPDQQAYDRWERERVTTRQQKEREQEIAHLQARLKKLTGED